MKTGKRIKPGTQAGFSLIELMITVAIVAILAMIAYPSYTNSITKTHRRSAEACLSNYVQYMERYYTVNMRYDQNVDGDDNALPAIDCASAQNTGKNYGYEITDVDRSSYTLSAVPKSGSAQASRDAACGTLTLNQAGTRGVSGSAGAADCW